MAEPKIIELSDIEAGLRRRWNPQATEVKTEPKAAEPVIEPKEEVKTNAVTVEPKIESVAEVKHEVKAEVKEEVVKTEPTYADRTETAVNEALDMLPEDMKPSEEYLVSAIKNLKDLDKLSDTARASAIIKEAMKSKALELANAPKEELKKKVQLPGTTHNVVAPDDLQKRLNSNVESVRSKACKEGIMQHFYSKGLIEKPR